MKPRRDQTRLVLSVIAIALVVGVYEVRPAAAWPDPGSWLWKHCPGLRKPGIGHEAMMEWLRKMYDKYCLPPCF